MNKEFTIGIVLAVIAIALLATGCAETPTGQAVTGKPVIKVGASIAMSGDVAFLGENARQGAELAVSEWPNSKYTYKLVYEDDKMQAGPASTATQKLINIDGVNAMFSFSSGTGNVISPMAQEAKVIHFGVASDVNVAKGEYNFIHWTPPEAEVEKWVEEAEKRGYQSVSILCMNHQGALAIAEPLRDELLKQGFDVNWQLFNDGTTDFKTIIEKMGDSDAYFVLAFSPNLERIYKQMKELGIEKPISAIESYDLTETPELFEGEWYVSYADATDGFNRKFEERYDDTPGMGAPNTYDIMNMLITAYEAAGDGVTVPSNEAVIVELNKLQNFPGALGSLTVGQNGIVWSDAAVKEIVNGRGVSVY